MLYSGSELGWFALPERLLTIDEELNQLEDNVRRLKIEYDVFFGGGAKKPPAELEWRVQSLMKKYSDGRRMNFGQRFKFGSIQQKYAVFNSLWQQKLRIKEEGYRRPQDALLSIQGVRQFDDQAQEANGKSQPFRVACSDVEKDAKNVRALYDAMVKASRDSKGKAPGSFESFRKFVKNKTEQLRKDFAASAVEYAVEVADGQVRLKAKAK